MQGRIEKHSGSTITLTSKKTLVGRGPTCDLVIPHLSISRCHAELSLAGALLTVRDLKSRNGTYVDEHRIESSEVRTGQLLRFGSITFLIASTSPAINDEDAETQSLDQARDSMLAEVERLGLTAAQRRVFDLLLEGLPRSRSPPDSKSARTPFTITFGRFTWPRSVGSRAELLARFVSREAFKRICIPSNLDAVPPPS